MAKVEKAKGDKKASHNKPKNKQKALGYTINKPPKKASKE